MTTRTAVEEGCAAEAPNRSATYVGAALLVTALSALFFYKWSGSLRALRTVEHTGVLNLSPSFLTQGGVLTSTLHYFQKIWPALAYGIVIGAIVRSTVSPRWIASLLGRTGWKPTLAGAAAGAPLMLCSCCVTPVFTGVYERGGRLGASLSMMLASPGLNIAAIAITFILMPSKFAAVRVAAALLAVFALAPAIARLNEKSISAGKRQGSAIAKDDVPPTGLALVARFAKSLVYMAVVTVPLIFCGVLLSALLLPHAGALSAHGTAVAVVLVALVGTLIALPTFFEIPIAFLLLQLGAPPGAAVALLIAGPIVNLPSLFVLGRETNARVALSLGFGIWALASLGGFVASV